MGGFGAGAAYRDGWRKASSATLQPGTESDPPLVARLEDGELATGAPDQIGASPGCIAWVHCQRWLRARPSAGLGFARRFRVI